jgi:hypothetical protein
VKLKILIPFLTVSALIAAGCGQSSADKAKNQVCDARSDIQKQVNELRNLTPATATTSGVKDSLNAIKNDLKKIADAQPKLNDQRKQQVQDANSQFKSQFNSILSDIGTNLSLTNAGQQLKAAVQQLASAYQASFAKVDCGG